MTDQPNQVTEHYKEMLNAGSQQSGTMNAQSETQKQLLDMDPGSRSSLEFTQGVYQTGGNERASSAEKAEEPLQSEG